MSKKTGDTAIFDYGYISENQIKSSGIKYGTKRDVYGHINKCYYNRLRFVKTLFSATVFNVDRSHISTPFISRKNAEKFFGMIFRGKCARIFNFSGKNYMC